MEHYGSITTPVSVPRLIVGAMLAAGVAVLIMAFTKYGLLAGLAVSVIPAALCILWVTLRNPAISMLGLFVVNYFIMTLTRYAYDLPFGMILDALIFYNFLIITLQALMRPIEWKRASSGLTVVAAIWMAYCILEIVNPESVSVAGWFSSVRSIAFYFFFIVVLTQLTMTEYKYLKYMLAVWSVLTLIAVGKACMQKFFGFNAAENYWLFVLGGRSTHIIHSGVRYFSFFSDAANFGGSMGLSMVVFSISALYYRNSWMKLYLLLVAAAACYGMLISGTRSALAVPFVGYSAFIMMSRNIKMIGAGVFLIIAAFIFLKFTTIGQGNSIIRRARSAFNTNDPSFQVRLANQAKLRELMADKPFGAGLGHGGGKAKTFAPNAALSQIPTDSWFVMVWVETGVVGILLHIGILLAVLFYSAHNVMWDYNFGFSLPSLPDGFMDAVTLATILACLVLGWRRLAVPASSYVTRQADWFSLLLVTGVMVTGFASAHGFGSESFMALLHVLFGEAILICLPFTRLSHAILIPFTRAYMGSESIGVRRTCDW